MYKKNIVWDRGVKYFHDDLYTDERIMIPDFPMKNVFGDFRIFNGLPIELVDEYIGELMDVFRKLDKDHKAHEDYWKTHPNGYISRKGE